MEEITVSEPKRTGLLKLLGSSLGCQFVIPVYQRNYTWAADREVKQYFDDLENVLHGNYKNHFLGIIIYLEKSIDFSLRELSIIDGQQRLTTTFLIIYAIKQILINDNDIEKVQQLEGQYLTNPYHNDKIKYKLKPLVSDDNVYRCIVENRMDDITDTHSNVLKNYEYISNRLNELLIQGYDANAILMALNKLYVVCVPISEEDNAQKIFESINATGVKLTSADLIRNYLLNGTNITVEDDGNGMSYVGGEIGKYLNVARISRNSESDAETKLGRKKMGRKGVGKLAALSVSENVLVKTITNDEKSGFILSRNVKDDRLLEALDESEIKFEKIKQHGTAIVMLNPQYKLHATIKAIKRNLLKLFPMVNEGFKIHIIRGKEEAVISNFDKDMIKELSSLITLGNEFRYLKDNFETKYPDLVSELCSDRDSIEIPLEMCNKDGKIKNYNLEIKGWIGTYLSTRGRKAEITDFPDNFISLFANKKMGEFNILPSVGQNKLNEVYVVGQLHVDLFELTELPDMALSNRQGYKTDDIRYQKVLETVRNVLLPDILKMREKYVSFTKETKKKETLKKQKEHSC